MNREGYTLKFKFVDRGGKYVYDMMELLATPGNKNTLQFRTVAEVRIRPRASMTSGLISINWHDEPKETESTVEGGGTG